MLLPQVPAEGNKAEEQTGPREGLLDPGRGADTKANGHPHRMTLLQDPSAHVQSEAHPHKDLAPRRSLEPLFHHLVVLLAGGTAFGLLIGGAGAGYVDRMLAVSSFFFGAFVVG